MHRPPYDFNRAQRLLTMVEIQQAFNFHGLPIAGMQIEQAWADVALSHSLSNSGRAFADGQFPDNLPAEL